MTTETLVKTTNMTRQQHWTWLSDQLINIRQEMDALKPFLGGHDTANGFAVKGTRKPKTTVKIAKATNLNGYALKPGSSLDRVLQWFYRHKNDVCTTSQGIAEFSAFNQYVQPLLKQGYVTRLDRGQYKIADKGINYFATAAMVNDGEE